MWWKREAEHMARAILKYSRLPCSHLEKLRNLICSERTHYVLTLPSIHINHAVLENHIMPSCSSHIGIDWLPGKMSEHDKHYLHLTFQSVSTSRSWLKTRQTATPFPFRQPQKWKRNIFIIFLCSVFAI